MTSQSPRIYLYKITFEEVPYYYYGVHKEKLFGEEYWGSPKTNKWCWEIYTPKKQILEIFEFGDEGWLEAQEVETRLIKPFYNTDKWCLNESCGGKTSLKILSENGKKYGKEYGGIGGKKTGNKNKETGHIYELGRIYGLKHKENKTGIFGRSEEKINEDTKKGGNKAYEMKVGVHARTKEQMIGDGKKGGSISGKKNYENGIGLASITKEERQEIVAKTNSQKWMCLETGYITTAGPLTKYQRSKGIDTSKRKRIE